MRTRQRPGGGGDRVDNLTPNFSGLVTLGVFVLGGWIAIRNGINLRFSELEAKQARLDERMSHVEEFARSASDLGAQLSALSAKLDDLRADVAKHNNVIERTFKLETRMDAAIQDIEDMKDDRRIGGTR